MSEMDPLLDIQEESQLPVTEYKFKVVVVGASTAGKTSLLERLQSDTFSGNYSPTIGADLSFYSTTLRAGGVHVSISFWDLAGNPAYRAMVEEYVEDIDGCILVFSGDDPESFSALAIWAESLEERVRAWLDMPKLLLCNKKDLNSESSPTVRNGDVLRFANSHGMSYMTTSAKTGQGVMESFHELAEAMIDDVDRRYAMKKARQKCNCCTIV